LNVFAHERFVQILHNLRFTILATACSLLCGASVRLPVQQKAVVPPLVLMVDDDPAAREMARTVLEQSGFRVEEASSGFEAVEKALAQLPDVIVMDLVIPRFSGWEATRKVKTDPRTQHIPVIALTGDQTLSHHELARAAGCERVLVKPITAEAMVSEVRQALARSREHS
jgi:two-component system, cell cycle response regulator DivK